MRLAWFAVLASLSVAAHHAPAAPAPLPLSAGGPRIVVAFTNVPQGTPAPAGTTGTRYGGDAYRLAQGAQRQARRIGTAYALRELTSWPIEALAMHCVVYEVPDNRDVAQLIALLQKDTRVLLAEQLQEFHTLTRPTPPPTTIRCTTCNPTSLHWRWPRHRSTPRARASRWH
jgi:hypothetical protein